MAVHVSEQTQETAPSTEGIRGQIVGSTDSTNFQLALTWEQYSPYGWLVARHQSAGHGRHGRAWEAPEGTSLLVSVLVPTLTEPSLVPLAAGLAMRRVILEQMRDLPTFLKWPNDVLIGKQKVAGILTQYLERRGQTHWLVVGAGLNLTTPTSVLENYGATSLHAQGWSGSTGDDSLALLATRFAAHLQMELEKNAVVAEFSAHCPLLGQEVTASLPGGRSITGTAGPISPLGELLVAGNPVRAGEVTLAAKPIFEEQI